MELQKARRIWLKINISDKMNENKVIAQTLQKSTHVFANF